MYIFVFFAIYKTDDMVAVSAAAAWPTVP